MPTAERPKIGTGSNVLGRNIVIEGVVLKGPVRGVVTSVFASGALASVRFRIPARPMVCAECGSHAHLSVNGATGEIVCMRSHCGHGHGFEEYIIPSLTMEKLEALPSDAELARMAEWREKVKLRKRELEWAQNALKDTLAEGERWGWTE